MEDNNKFITGGKTEGPKAPKDPVERRNGFFVLYETAIEATARAEGRPSQEVYLEGNYLIDKARYIGGVTDETILELLRSSAGFHRLVHSIGVSVRTNNDQVESVPFLLQNWGKSNKYESGTHVLVPCPSDGTEVMLKLEDIEWSEDDEVLGKFAFEFNHEGELATASVIFYLNDGYSVPELITETPVPFDSNEYQNIITKSLLHAGNNTRLKAAIEKAKRGEDVTIAYIGGSITQGAGAKPIHTECYAYQSYLRFKELFSKDGENIHFVKAGVGGTPSELGVIRYDRDILRDGTVTPDIVIVEFAVNDEGDETKGNCFESLCLKILSADNRPAVVVLFSVFINDWNLQERLSPIGRRYNLPMVSVKDAVSDQFRLSKSEGNIISKRQFFYDIYHPTSDGHRVMADCLAYLFSETDNALVDAYDILLDQPPVIGNDFAETLLLDRISHIDVAKIEVGGFSGIDMELQMVEMDANPFGTPEFPHNWMHSAASGEQSFKLTITSKNLILVYKDSGSTEFGKADIYVDGKLLLTADPHVNNWTHCNPVILYQNEVSREHQVEIRMAPGDQDKCFTILGFGYTA